MTGATQRRTRPPRRRPPRAAQRPPRRRVPTRYLVRRWVVLGVAVALTAAVVVVFWTPLLGVRDIEVSGTAELTADEVRAAASVELGAPLVRLDTNEVEQRIARLPRIDSVRVSRSFPGTVRISVSERTPVLVVQRDDGMHLVDGTGRDFSTLDAAPAGLPALEPTGAAATTAAAVAVSALSDQLTALVASVTAPSEVDIRLTLADGRVVRWGGQEASAHKAAILGPLLSQPGETYDIAAPDFPTIAG
ncbi:cell division protein FtsQ/DivIB [Actinokineospora pegani]|uniref:cell division protein FtsQ/DivIB n=1 Tax=Actinokineospora pegani TaxID=2654637 RepID=UPI0012EA542E|nr:FtsQ-type POTRA domain-containing protein [Actinokineospora pegani]